MSFSSTVFSLSQFSQWVADQSKSGVLEERESKALENAVIQAKADKKPLAYLRRAITQLTEQKAISEKVGNLAKGAFQDYGKKKNINLVTSLKDSLERFSFYEFLAFPDEWRQTPTAVFSEFLRKSAGVEVTLPDEATEASLKTCFEKVAREEQLSPEVIEKIEKKCHECIGRIRDRQPRATSNSFIKLQPLSELSKCDPQAASRLTALPKDLLQLIVSKLPDVAFASLMITCKKICSEQHNFIANDPKKMSDLLRMYLSQYAISENEFNNFLRPLDSRTLSTPISLHRFMTPECNRKVLAKFPSTRELICEDMCPSEFLLGENQKPFAIEFLSFWNSPDTEAAREGFRKLIALCPDLRSLNISESTGIPAFSTLTLPTTLEAVNVGRSPLDDAGLARICAAPHLKDLVLCDCSDLTESGLRHIATIQSLKYLNLKNVAVNGLLLKEIFSKCTQLRSVVLARQSNLGLEDYLGLDYPASLEWFCTDLADINLALTKKLFVQCRKLRGVTPLNDQFTSAEIRELDPPPHLGHFSFGAHADSQAVSHVLSKCPALGSLSISGMQISVEEVRSLIGLSSITYLELKNTTIDQEQLELLLSKFPHLTTLVIDNCSGLSGFEFSSITLPRTLESLELPQMIFDSRQVATIMYQCPQLEYIKFT